MILTNQFTADYNYEQIDEDFDIYKVDKSSKHFDENILDLPTEIFKARAVQYTYGKTALVLFNKYDPNEKAFCEEIREKDPDATVGKIDILNADTRKGLFYYNDRLLLQLLLNSIHSPKNSNYAYNNLTGKLYYFSPKWKSIDKTSKKIYSCYFLEINLLPGMYVSLDVKTFRSKISNRKKMMYVIDRKTKQLRKKLSSEKVKPDEIFQEASFDKSRNTVKYLDFSSIDNFRSCKIGVLNQLLDDIEEKLGAYVELTPIEIHDDLCALLPKKEQLKLYDGNYETQLKSYGINIVDTCKTAVSQKICNYLKAVFKLQYDIDATEGSLMETKYNIRIIHEPDYYRNLGLKDPHQDDLHGCVVQHMMLETYLNLSDEEVDDEENISLLAMVNKVITELIIKGDIRNRKISIYHWNNFSHGKTWTFVTGRKIFGYDIDKVKDSKFIPFEFFVMKVNPEGKIAFNHFNNIDLPFESDEWKISMFFADKYEKQHKNQKDVDGLVFSDINNIQVIIRTNRKTLPNIVNIKAALEQTNPKEKVRLANIIENLGLFEEKYIDNDTEKEKFAQVKDKLEKLDDHPSKKEIKEALNMRTKLGSSINRFLHDECGIWISPEMKNSDFDDQFLLSDIYDIKYYIDPDTDGKSIESLNYYAGLKKSSLKSSVPNACIVRQVLAEKELEFQELLPLLAVDFVKAGGCYTVLPFPFKYLHEFEENIKKARENGSISLEPGKTGIND